MRSPPVNESPKPGPDAVTAGRAALCFALLCLALSALAALGPRPDDGRAGLSRGFVPLSLWGDQAVRPVSAAVRAAAPPAGPAPPARPAFGPLAPRATHFFPAVY